MPVPSRRLKELIEGTVDHYASQRWPALEEVTVSWRGSYGYLTGYLSEDDDDTIKLCRIQYLGDPDDWAFAIWQASTDSYADAVLLDGHRTGHPNQALDTACTLYLASPGDQPADPLKDLRGAALAAGLRPRVDADAAVDGIDELLYMLPYVHPFRPESAHLRGQGETIHIHATDVDVHWLIEMTPEGHAWERSDDAAGQASATMRGNAGEVHLFQYNRLSDQVADVECTGDRAVLSEWLARSAL